MRSSSARPGTSLSGHGSPKSFYVFSTISTISRKSSVFQPRAGFSGKASLGRTSLMLIVSATTAAALISYNTDLMSPIRADAPPSTVDRTKERGTIARGVAKVKETAAHLLHSGHEHMGVHLWGTNRYKVVAPEGPSVASLSGAAVQKRPVYLKSLAGQTFRDLALHERYAVAVTSSGDLIQWGSGYSQASVEPERTLRGMDVADVALTSSKIYARTRSGKVLILPADKETQQDTVSRPMPSVGWYWRMLGYHNPGVQYAIMRVIDADGKDVSKKIKSISAGRNHLLALSTDGKALAACVDSDANESGQLGSARLLETVAGSSREQTVSDHDILFDDTLKEIPVLRKLNMVQLVAGDRHSLALTSEGRVLGWGNNSNGQLALGSAYSFPMIPTPTEAALTATYPKTARIVPRTIAAGGDTSYFVVDRDDLKAQSDPDPQGLGLADGSTRRTYCDLLASGQGMNGQLGNGQWNSSGQASRVKTVSGLTEFNESTQTIQQIPIESVSIASTHAAIVLGNALHDPVTKQYFGHDVFLVGHNADYQLGTGKRSNLAVPQHIGPLPYAKLIAEAASAQGATGEATDEIALSSAEESVDSGSRTHMPHKRLQLAPRTWNHRKAEERIVCGYGTTAVYWHVDP